jgi:hypothetical protein
MTSGRGIFGFLLCMLLVAAPAHAQSPADQQETLRQIGVWSQNSQDIYREITALVDLTLELDTVMARWGGDDKSSQMVAADIEAWRTRYEAETARLAQRIADQPPPPDATQGLGAGAIGLQGAMNSGPELHRRMLERVARLGPEMAEGCLQVLRGEINGAEASERRRWNIMIEMINVHQASLSVVMAAIAENHPGNVLARGRREMGTGALRVIEVFAADPLGGKFEFSAAQRADFRAAARQIRSLSVEGRAATRRARGVVEVAQEFSPDVRRQMGAAVGTYNQSFDTMLSAASVLDHLAEVRSNEATFDALLELLNQIIALDEQINDQDNVRIRAIANLGTNAL